MTTKNLSATRVLIGKRDHLKPSSFIEQVTIHLMQLIRQREIPLREHLPLHTSRAMATEIVTAIRSKLVLMNATYKTTMYAIPLFFICVHINVGYTVGYT